jgi:hypothetical protein
MLMVNRNYKKGRRFEYKVKALLEKCGFYVMRTAGSHSKFDLIAIRTQRFQFDDSNLFMDISNMTGTNVLLIQCKYGQNISKKERKELVKFYNKHYTIIPIIVYGKPREDLKVYILEEHLYVTTDYNGSNKFKCVEIDKDGIGK